MLSFSKRRACQRNFTSQFGAAEDGMYYEGAKPVAAPIDQWNG